MTTFDQFREFVVERMRLRNKLDSQTDPHKRLWLLNDVEAVEHQVQERLAKEADECQFRVSSVRQVEAIRKLCSLYSFKGAVFIVQSEQLHAPFSEIEDAAGEIGYGHHEQTVGFAYRPPDSNDSDSHAD